MPIAYILSFSLFVRLFSPVPAVHDLKLSVCEIVYQTETGHFELTFYLFQDDLKAALYSNPDAPLIKAEDVAAYIGKRFEWQVNQKKQELRFQSLREKNDQVAVLFASAPVPYHTVTAIEVSNTLLVEQFSEQVNMVYATLPSQAKKVQMLTAGKTAGQFSF